MLVLAGCRQPDASSPAPPNNTLRIGLGQVPSSPTQGLNALAQTLTGESLARLGDDGRPQPLLARDWQISPDRRSLTVNLVPRAKFHDGTPLTSSIVADALKSSMPAFMGPAFEDVESVEAPNAEQVVIRLRRPSPFLLDTLETVIVKPGSPLVGTGPFVALDGKSPKELRANSEYRLGKPTVERITVETFPSVRAAWAEMLRGRLDMLYEVGVDALDSLQASNNIAIFTFTRRFQYVIVLNTKTDAFRPKAIRRALNMAIDRNAVVRDALGGHGVASSGPVWPRNYAFRGAAGTPRYDVAEAAKTLSSGARTPATTPKVHFTCLIGPDAIHERIALVIKRQLAAVGIDMSVEQVGLDVIANSTKSRQFEAVLLEMISGPTLLRPYRLWHSGGGNGASSAEIDAALDRVRSAASDDEYATSISAFQEAVIDDPPAIFLAWMERARAVSKRFEVPAAEAGRDIMSNLRLWKPSDAFQQASRN
jgi:peptide/nickel transport system substrate-binding protein